MSKIEQKQKVIVGLSGGVDSAVAALLLKNQGYAVTGVFMQNWEADRNDPYCTAEQDLSDAKAVCERLDIPFQVVNFSKDYWERVFQLCLDEWKVARTPNPDILCNQEIKFKAFLDYALEQGADYMATGHYARVTHDNSTYQLRESIDTVKDQTYFLYTLNQKILSHVLFPLADYPKSEIRALAKEAGLLNYNKKDSTGICFIGERHFKSFLQEYLLNEPGEIHSDTGKLLGKHDGLMFYTLGQRKGLAIGGVKATNESPWYVVEKDPTHNRLIVGQGHDHPTLFKSLLTATNLHWVNENTSLPKTCLAKTRYHQPFQKCTLTHLGDDRIQVDFDVPQRAITPGQSVVLYHDSLCLGGGIIE